ncbi:hypothetical protein T4D_3907 [Trichinella pseudospiralis]|uniref:Uncharacterized protein n=1 Tax=Trichinella pseudospiralis TaxID=6337 RepID=A0A0V1FEJ6_TRIPS|nr:hypothetical protein T4D_3907 [Trichinella pseudospiralis]
MVISYGYRVLSYLNIMNVRGEGCNIIQRPHLAWVVVAHALLHCMPDQLLICQDDEMSSPMLILKVIKTEIQGKQLTPNARSCFRLPEVSEKYRVDQHPFSHCQKIAPFQKLDALTTDDNAAPCRGWRNTVAVTSTCFVSSYTSITSCKSNFFFFPKSDLNLSSGASNVSAHAMKRSNNIVLNFLNR